MAKEHKVKIVLEYPYGGDEEVTANIQQAEHDALMAGEVSLEDIIAAGGATVSVTAEEVETAEG